MPEHTVESALGASQKVLGPTVSEVTRFANDQESIMKTFGFAFAYICFTVCFYAAAAEQPAQEPDQLLSQIKTEGASAVVQAIWDTPRWADLTAHVATGKPRWVDVAIALSKGADGGAAEELQDALLYGLAKNPAYEFQVLPMDSSDASPFSLSTVCAGPSDPGTYSAALADLRRVESSVHRVSVVALEFKKDKCLKLLKAGESDLKRFFAVSN